MAFLRSIGLVGAVLALGCTPDFAFDSDCDPANRRLDRCIFDAGPDGTPLPFPSEGCADFERPCNGQDDDCDPATRDDVAPEGQVCRAPGEVGTTLPGVGEAWQVTRYLLVDDTEVTWGHWSALAAVDDALPPLVCPIDGCCDDACPVVGVRWFDAVAFANARTAAHNAEAGADTLEPCYVCTLDEAPIPCHRASTIHFEGPACTGYRLPTELEWLHVAALDMPQGGEPAAEVGVFGQAPCAVRPVAAPDDPTRATADGLSDWLGNAAEWVHDGYGPIVAAAAGPEVIDPTGETRGDEGGELERTVRGGSACTPLATVVDVLSWRAARAPTYASPDIGFRLVRSAGSVE